MNINPETVVSTYNNFIQESKPKEAHELKIKLEDKIESMINKNKDNPKLAKLKEALRIINQRAERINDYFNDHTGESATFLADDFLENKLNIEEQLVVIENIDKTEKKIQRLDLKVAGEQVSRIAQFTEILKLQQQKNPDLERIFRKDIYHLPYSMKLSKGAIYVITKEVRGTGEFKKAKRAREIHEEVKLIWATANKPKDASKAKAVQEKFLQEAEHEAQIYTLFKGIPGIAQFRGIESYTDKNGEVKMAIVMDEYETSLKMVMETKGLSERQQIHFAIRFLEGLRAMHTRKITHQDLKPDNIFINYDGDELIPFIADMGLATNTSSVIKRFGTVGYLSPEIFARQQRKWNKTNTEPDPFAQQEDIFAAGMILYELFHKSRPKWSLDQAYIPNKLLIDGPKQDYEATMLQQHVASIRWEKEPPKSGTYDSVIKGLMEPNPGKRLTLEEAIEQLKRL